MLAVGYFLILPPGLKAADTYEALPTTSEDEVIRIPPNSPPPGPRSFLSSLKRTTRRLKPLVIPYMAPLFLVYVSEYTINQVVASELSR